MRIKCLECNLKLTANDVNVNTMTATCPACSTVFAFADQVTADNVEVSSVTTNRSKSKVKRFGVTSTLDGVLLKLRWRNLESILLWVIICIVLVFAIPSVISWHQEGPLVSLAQGEYVVMAILTPVLTILFYAVVIYSTLMHLVNSKIIHVDRNRLWVKFGPLPSYGNKRIVINSRQISQIYVREEYHKEYRRSRYRVCAIVDGTHVTLTSDLTKNNAAVFIENEIEQYLGLKDRTV